MTQCNIENNINIFQDNHYVDHCQVRAVGGKGGDGYLSFSSIWQRQWNGPDGGDGGNGGHVIFVGK